MQRGKDITVIGGGIAGLGIAWEAARRGFQVTLLEKNICCHATSRNSLRIIHGGFRYLQSFDLKRVCESIRAQHELLQRFPEYIKVLPCIMPLERAGKRSRLPVQAAIKIYGMFVKHLTKQRFNGKILNNAEVRERIPLLENLCPDGALLWSDATLVNADKFNLHIKDSVEKAGAVIREHSKVMQIEREGDKFTVRYQSREGEREIKTGAVINVAGPWINSFKRDTSSFASTKWCKAFNVVLRKQLEGEFAFGMPGESNRLFFVVPRPGKSAIGTWYVALDSIPQQIEISEAELKQFIEAINVAMPAVKIERADIEDVEVGILPMRSVGPNGPVLYGAEQIQVTRRYIEVLSTKYTTFLEQGRKVLRCLEA